MPDRPKKTNLKYTEFTQDMVIRYNYIEYIEDLEEYCNELEDEIMNNDYTNADFIELEREKDNAESERDELEKENTELLNENQKLMEKIIQLKSVLNS